jgi:hypothetical protein
VRVHSALNKWQRRQFNYGDADCCQFTAFVVKELTGRDYSSQFEYTSEAEAELIVGRKGELVDFIASVLGKASSDLKDGDPCVVDIPIAGQVCGIKLSDKIVCLTARGMVRIPDRYLLAGWSV